MYQIRTKLHLAGAIAVVLALQTLNSTPAAAVQFTGCLTPGGDIKNVAIGVTPSKPCGKSGILITWNSKGDKGDTGDQGIQGIQGATGPQGPAGEVTASQLLELEVRILALEGGGDGEKRVFVTFGAFAPEAGDFNSVADADVICRGAAMNAGLTDGNPGSPEFLAWLSAAVTNGTSFATSPSARFNRSASPYISTDVLGTVIANNWDDLTDGTLAAPIVNDEFGVPRVDVGVWTGTHPDGAPTGCDCDSWSLFPVPSETCVHFFPFDTPAATIGDSTAPLGVGVEWTELEFSLCDAPHALYCFEQ